MVYCVSYSQLCGLTYHLSNVSENPSHCSNWVKFWWVISAIYRNITLIKYTSGKPVPCTEICGTDVWGFHSFASDHAVQHCFQGVGWWTTVSWLQLLHPPYQDQSCTAVGELHFLDCSNPPPLHSLPGTLQTLQPSIFFKNMIWASNCEMG